ncbi:MAG: hypothetical protein JXB47_20735 [Anaerolineae bacterium]|nr:hypothetical protein [Anaerolineae bacterium]
MLALVVVVALLLVFPGVARAQGDDPGTLPGGDLPIVLPGWVEQLAFGTLGLSLLVSAATEVTKRLLALAGLYKDGLGRYVAIVWTFGFVALALASNLLDAGAVVNPRVEWMYQLMLLLLTLLGAPTAHAWAKATGLVGSMSPGEGS